MAKTMICSNCGYKGKTKKVTKGSIFIEIILWFAFLVPGIIYSIWRLTSKHRACPQCGTSNMIPLDSPRGIELTASTNSPGQKKTIEDEEKKCPACAEKIKFEAIKCRFCGHEFDPGIVEEEIRQQEETLSKPKETAVPQIQEIELPENSYYCQDCDYVIKKDEFEESNLFCPDCSSPLEET